MKGPKYKYQDNSTFENIQPMINFDLDKGKQYLELLTTKVTPKKLYKESTIEIIQGTFEHININPIFDEPPSINRNKTLSKYPKRKLRIDLNQMRQQQEMPKGTCTIGMPKIPPLE